MSSVDISDPPHPPRSVRWGPWKLQPQIEPFKRLKVLALHGFGGAPGELRPLGQALRSHGFLSQALLLPGHGENLDQMAEIRLSDWTEAVQESYESLRQDGSPVVLLGFCLGGALALALSETLRPRALCLLSTPMTPFRDDLFPRVGGLRSLEKSINDSPSAEVRRWRGMGSHPLVPESFFEQYQILLRQLSRRPPEVTCPFLVAQSRSDAITSPVDAERIAEAARSSRGKLVWSRRAGHALPIDVGRRELFREILAFLEAEETHVEPRFD